MSFCYDLHQHGAHQQWMLGSVGKRRHFLDPFNQDLKVSITVLLALLCITDKNLTTGLNVLSPYTSPSP